MNAFLVVLVHYLRVKSCTIWSALSTVTGWGGRYWGIFGSPKSPQVISNAYMGGPRKIIFYYGTCFFVYYIALYPMQGCGEGAGASSIRIWRQGTPHHLISSSSICYQITLHWLNPRTLRFSAQSPPDWATTMMMFHKNKCACVFLRIHAI